MWLEQQKEPPLILPQGYLRGEEPFSTWWCSDRASPTMLPTSTLHFGTGRLAEITWEMGHSLRNMRFFSREHVHPSRAAVIRIICRDGVKIPLRPWEGFSKQSYFHWFVIMQVKPPIVLGLSKQCKMNKKF